MSPLKPGPRMPSSALPETSRKDERGYNQLWAPSQGTTIRNRRRALLLANSLNAKPGGRILEIGSGAGTKVSIVAEQTMCRVTGLDLSQEFTDRARDANRSNPMVEFTCASVRSLADEAPHSYDAVYGDGILHHLVYDLNRTFELLNRLLVPGGRIAFIEPNKANPYVFLAFNLEKLRTLTHLEPDEMAFSKSFAISKLHAAGFGEVNVAYRDFLLPGAPRPIVPLVVAAGKILERVPALRVMSQSILLTGKQQS
jgi:SAM-dependent methyltransferase